ncbi:MAG: hypothetical protein RDU14_07695 [Melioribacteraceae bacterium]|nr:hypothetical protein [Melioribacteraceae bacterium]
MSINHLDVDIEGKIRKSEFILDEFRVEITINCLEVYSKSQKIASKNKIATLLESYRRNETSPNEFEKQILIHKKTLKENFISKLNSFDEEFIFFCFKSNNNLINHILQDLKSECISLFKSKSIQFIDISNCLSKKINSETSDKHSFETIIDSYDFNKDICFSNEREIDSNFTKLLIIDDVISNGKAIYTLLVNLY